MQSKSRSKEHLSEEKLHFFEKSSKETKQQQKPSYTREYSYDIDSETLRHSGQSDPRGLGFSYEKSGSQTAPFNKAAPQKQQGTALAFTYNPQKSSKADLAPERLRTQQKELQTSKIVEPSFIERKTVQNHKNLYEDRNLQTRAKSPVVKGEAMQSNIDESSELSSTSQESMVDEYAKESMRQKTSALIAGSAANAPPTLTKSNIYKLPPTSFTQQTPPLKSTTRSAPNDNDHQQRYGLTTSAKTTTTPKRSSLWGQDDEPIQSSTSRLPVLSPTEAAGVERKYTHVSRKRFVKNADGTYEERDETPEPNSIEPKSRLIANKSSTSMVKYYPIFSFDYPPHH